MTEILCIIRTTSRLWCCPNWLKGHRACAAHCPNTHACPKTYSFVPKVQAAIGLLHTGSINTPVFLATAKNYISRVYYTIFTNFVNSKIFPCIFRRSMIYLCCRINLNIIIIYRCIFHLVKMRALFYVKASVSYAYWICSATK